MTINFYMSRHSLTNLFSKMFFFVSPVLSLSSMDEPSNVCSPLLPPSIYRLLQPPSPSIWLFLTSQLDSLWNIPAGKIQKHHSLELVQSSNVCQKLCQWAEGWAAASLRIHRTSWAGSRSQELLGEMEGWYNADVSLALGFSVRHSGRRWS